MPASLDLKSIREQPDLYRRACVHKKVNADIERIIALDAELRPRQQEIEKLQAERNATAKQMKGASPEQQQRLRERGVELKQELEQATLACRALQEELGTLMLVMPLPPRADVPIGASDQDNVEIKKHGTPPQFDFQPKDHVELGKINDGIDIERAVKLAGSRSYMLKGFVARLENAVLQYVWHKLLGKGFTPFSVPVLLREHALIGSGYFPAGREQTYRLEKDELALVGTSEVPLVAYHQDEILARDELPRRYMAHSSCFRREAGTYGKDTHGLFRVHQFQKIEQLIISVADEHDSERLHNELLANSEEIVQDLGLPYRVVEVCTGDLGVGQYRKHDIETWMPSRNAYGETHSCSTLLDFQARRLKIRYRGHDKSKRWCYTLNNTAIASPRILIPLLECNQTAEGKINVPACLQPYM